MAVKKPKPRRSFNDEQRSTYVHQIDDYRREHPGVQIAEAIRQLGLDINVDRYRSFKNLLAMRSNGGDHIPLDAIPERIKRQKVGAAAPAYGSRLKNEIATASRLIRTGLDLLRKGKDAETAHQVIEIGLEMLEKQTQ